MRKKVFLVIISSLLFLLTSCLNNFHGLDSSKQNLVSYIEDGVIEYQGEKYHKVDNNIFEAYTAEEKEKMVLVSWHYNFPFTGVAEFYSYSTESPSFIIEPNIMHSIWVKKAFDYKKEIFVVENTDIEIVFSSAFNKNKFITPIEQHKVETFYWYDKSYNLLKTKVNVFCVDGIYYLQTRNMSLAYQISDEFAKLLMENGIIEAD